jgi:hypothetical protein
VDDVLKPEECMTIEYHSVEEFLVEGNDLPFDLEIWQNTYS